MKPIIITIHVNAGAAIRARRGSAGATQIVLTDKDLDQLTEAQRDTLAHHYERSKSPWGVKGPQWADPLAWHAEPVDRASLDVLKGLLDRRLAVMNDYTATWVAPTSGRPEDVLLSLARHLPRQDMGGYSWPVVQSALLFGAERCAMEQHDGVEPPSPSLAMGDDPPWAGWG